MSTCRDNNSHQSGVRRVATGNTKIKGSKFMACEVETRFFYFHVDGHKRHNKVCLSHSHTRTPFFTPTTLHQITRRHTWHSDPEIAFFPTPSTTRNVYFQTSRRLSAVPHATRRHLRDVQLRGQRRTPEQPKLQGVREKRRR